MGGGSNGPGFLSLPPPSLLPLLPHSPSLIPLLPLPPSPPSLFLLPCPPPSLREPGGEEKTVSGKLSEIREDLKGHLDFITNKDICMFPPCFRLLLGRTLSLVYRLIEGQTELDPPRREGVRCSDVQVGAVFYRAVSGWCSLVQCYISLVQCCMRANLCAVLYKIGAVHIVQF